jgi:plasmid maintenance system antidote protein VapI
MTSEGLGNMTPQRALPSEGQTGAARRPAEVFHVSAFIQDEMDARGWGLEELEQASALPLGRLAAIMDGKHLTVACTRALGKAVGTSADLWEHLDAAWWASLEAYSRGGLRAGVVCPRCGQPEYFACAPSCFDADGKHWRVAAWQPGKEETPMADWKTTAAEPREGFEDRDDWREKTRALTAQLRQSEAMREAQISNVKAFTDETIRLAERNLRLEKELRDVTAERDEAITALRGLASFAYSLVNPSALPDAYHRARRIIEAVDEPIIRAKRDAALAPTPPTAPERGED